jgi:hypothetical protein
MAIANLVQSLNLLKSYSGVHTRSGKVKKAAKKAKRYGESSIQTPLAKKKKKRAKDPPQKQG